MHSFVANHQGCLVIIVKPIQLRLYLTYTYYQPQVAHNHCGHHSIMTLPILKVIQVTFYLNWYHYVSTLPDLFSSNVVCTSRGSVSVHCVRSLPPTPDQRGESCSTRPLRLNPPWYHWLISMDPMEIVLPWFSIFILIFSNHTNAAISSDLHPARPCRDLIRQRFASFYSSYHIRTSHPKDWAAT